MHPAYTSAILIGALGAIAYTVYCYFTAQNENWRTHKIEDPGLGGSSSWREQGGDETTTSKRRIGSEKGYRCTICQDTLEEHFSKLKCSHEFHVSCIRRWLSIGGKCPICRAN